MSVKMDRRSSLAAMTIFPLLHWVRGGEPVRARGQSGKVFRVVMRPDEVGSLGQGTINAYLGDSRIWTDGVESQQYAYSSEERHVVYVRQFQGEGRPLTLICRSENGSVKWTRGLWDGALEALWDGGSILLVLPHGPTKSDGSLRRFESFLDVLGRWCVFALRAGDGEILWSESEAQVGLPLWTDGELLVSVGFLPGASRGRARSATGRVVLFVRDALTGKMIRSHVLPGVPGRRVAIERTARGRRLVLTGPAVYDVEGFSHVRRCAIELPDFSR